jgi:hypothetical protein
LKTEVDFVPRGADFRCDYNSPFFATRSGLRDATRVVDFVPRGMDFKMQKTKSTSERQNQIKNQRKRVVLPLQRA